MKTSPSILGIFGLTFVAMLAFAANSVLTRLALSPEHIDAISFGTIRVLSATVLLSLIVTYANKQIIRPKPKPMMALGLLTYIIGFSISYASLNTGTGALILFGVVQITMIGTGLAKGEKLSKIAWVGLVLAIAGLLYLMLPSANAPDPVGTFWMILAGFGWALYSLLGRGSKKPLEDTASNFIWSIPVMLVLFLIFHENSFYTAIGIVYAILSGCLASGLGYVIWYKALPLLSVSSSASVQLSVPIIAAMGGVVFISEPFTSQLIIASVVTLSGIYLVISQSQKK